VVSYYFPPTGGGGVQRWLKYIKYLSRWDWEFTVITTEPESSGSRDDSLLNDLPANTHIIRTDPVESSPVLPSKISFLSKSGYWQRWISAFFHITDRRQNWNRKARVYIKREMKKNKYDAVILTSPPYSLALLAAELRGDVKCPLYLDLRDPWSINPYKIYPTPLHRYIDKIREEKTIAGVKFIISAYQSTLNDYKKRIKDFKENQSLFLPNGFDEEDFSNLEMVDIPHKGKFNLGFSGSIYSHLNTPEPVFAAMQVLKKRNTDIHFHHIGLSVYDISRWADLYGISDRVHLWGYKDHCQSLGFLKNMDALCIILDERWLNAGNTVGGKLYEYLRLRIPILAIIPENGEAANTIRKTNSGIIVSSKNIEQIVMVLELLITKSQTFSWIGLEEYNREFQAQTLKKYLEYNIQM
jgi:glycosyltransferase involved in cell wall biosynthesis